MTATVPTCRPDPRRETASPPVLMIAPDGRPTPNSPVSKVDETVPEARPFRAAFPLDRGSGEPRGLLVPSEAVARSLPRVVPGRSDVTEPILVPKLRIHFADFPYLHCSIDQRLFTSETCCGYGYDVAPDSTEVPPWGFQGPATGLGTLREPQSFAEISLLHPLSGRTPSRLPATLQRKENSSPA